MCIHMGVRISYIYISFKCFLKIISYIFCMTTAFSHSLINVPTTVILVTSAFCILTNNIMIFLTTKLCICLAWELYQAFLTVFNKCKRQSSYICKIASNINMTETPYAQLNISYCFTYGDQGFLLKQQYHFESWKSFKSLHDIKQCILCQTTWYET